MKLNQTILFVLAYLTYIAAMREDTQSTHGHRTYGICNVRLPRSFSTEGLSLPPHPDPIHFSRFNVLSFNNLYANGGHIGGRVAARNNINIAGGFLIGDQVLSGKISKKVRYSLVSGQSTTWNSGTLLPNYESAFVGGNFTGPQYLQSRVSATCAIPGCLDAGFAHSQLYHVAISNFFASLPSNVAVTFQYSGIYLSCGSPFNDGPSYVAYIPAAYFTAMSWYSVNSNCNQGATWVLNVVQSGNVVFQGGAFPGIPEQVLYNINDTRNIQVTTGVNGNILAPLSTFSQSSGNTNALVIVGDISMIQTSYNPSCNFTRHHGHHHHHNSSSTPVDRQDGNTSSSQAIFISFFILLLGLMCI